MPTDAKEWLNRYVDVPRLEEPMRAVWLPEQLELGDVMDSGWLLTSPLGTMLEHGRYWVTERQSKAASYYGWRQVPGTFTYRVGQMPAVQIER